MSDDSPASPKREIQERLVKRGEEEKDFDREFWRAAGHEARWNAAFEMVVEYHRFKGEDINELRLDRSVEHIFRRKR